MAGYPFGSPLLAMPPSTPPPAHPHQSPSAPSRNAPATPNEHGHLNSPAHSVHSPFASSHSAMAESQQHQQQQQHAAQGTPSHQVPFNATPVQHAPTQLTFGFASAPSTSSSSKAFMQPTLPWGTPAASTSFGNAGFGSQVRAPFGSATASPSSSSAAAATSFGVGASASSANTRRAEAKRRRDDDDDECELDRDSEMSSAVADHGAGEAGGSPSRSSRASPGAASARTGRQNLPKRIRAGLVWGGAPSPTPSTMDDSNPSSPGPTTWSSGRAAGASANAGGAAAAALKLSEEEGVDLGKLLATLDRPSLLLLVTRLLQSSPDASLPLQMLSHLPSPSLQAVQAALDDAERAVRSVLPSNLHEVRPEYAWGRLKAPILEFVSTAQRFMPFFTGRSGSGGSGQQSKTSSLGAAVAGLGAREPPHPSTTFDFLAEISARILRLQAALPPVPPSILAFASAANSSGHGGAGRNAARRGPSSSSGSEASRAYSSLLPATLLGPASPNALLSTLVPQLLDAWTELLTSVCRAVNDEGRMFGEESVKAWLATLQALGSAGDQAAQQRKDAEEREKHDSGMGHQEKGKNDGRQGQLSEAKETEAIRRIFDEIHSTVKREIGWLVAR